MQNVYQIADYRGRGVLAAEMARCYCNAGRLRQEFLNRELNALKNASQSQAILRLESLERGVPLQKSQAGWDLIYSMELLGDLPQVAARQVVRLAASRLRPGGRLLVANASVDSRLRECWNCARTTQIYRTELEMADLAKSLPTERFNGQAIFRDAAGLNVYLEIYRSLDWRETRVAHA